MAGSTGVEGDGGGDEGDGGGDERDGGAPTVERVMTVVSVVFTLALLGVVVWQATTAPAGVHPRVGVVDTETRADDRVEVTVELVNAGGVGLAAATVEVNCSSPPPRLTFQHVPASGRRRGTVVCPAGTAAPTATVTGWQEA